MRPATPTPTVQELLRSLPGQPGGLQLLSLGRGRDDLVLVGGAVRDLLLGRTPRELDVVVAGDVAVFAGELCSMLETGTSQHPSATLHERFGTAVVEWEGGRVDIAGRRAESYPVPGALPQLRPGTTDEDLRRRDFTVNAIAVPLGGQLQGELVCPEHALEDLAGGRLRVLHERSFIDDPTRLLRLARYRARLGFEPERRTAALAAEALGTGALATVSRARVGAELRLALGEADAAAALDALGELGVLSALDPRLAFDPRLARDALALLPEDGRPEVLLTASLLLGFSVKSDEDPEPALFELLDGLQFTAVERERVIRTALGAPSLVGGMEHAERPSELHRALSAHTLEAIALGVALGDEDCRAAAVQAAREWLDRLRHVRLVITGEDLLDAGVPAGPQIGRRLACALARKLDGELADGREVELRAALEAHL